MEQGGGDEAEVVDLSAAAHLLDGRLVIVHDRRGSRLRQGVEKLRVLLEIVVEPEQLHVEQTLQFVFEQFAGLVGQAKASGILVEVAVLQNPRQRRQDHDRAGRVPGHLVDHRLCGFVAVGHLVGFGGGDPRAEQRGEEVLGLPIQAVFSALAPRPGASPARTWWRPCWPTWFWGAMPPWS